MSSHIIVSRLMTISSIKTIALLIAAAATEMAALEVILDASERSILRPDARPRSCCLMKLSLLTQICRMHFEVLSTDTLFFALANLSFH